MPVSHPPAPHHCQNVPRHIRHLVWSVCLRSSLSKCRTHAILPSSHSLEFPHEQSSRTVCRVPNSVRDRSMVKAHDRQQLGVFARDMGGADHSRLIGFVECQHHAFSFRNRISAVLAITSQFTPTFPSWKSLILRITCTHCSSARSGRT